MQYNTYAIFWSSTGSTEKHGLAELHIAGFIYNSLVEKIHEWPDVKKGNPRVKQ